MPISCHFRDCKALLVTSSRVSSAIASTRPLPFHLFRCHVCVCVLTSVRRMFWCNTGDWSGVETARLDGSDRRLLAIDKVYSPRVLAVDLPVKRLYVMDTRMNSIQFCTYDGLQCHQVIAGTRVIILLLFVFFSDAFKDCVKVTCKTSHPTHCENLCSPHSCRKANK